MAGSASLPTQVLEAWIKASTHRKHKCFTCAHHRQVLDLNCKCSTSTLDGSQCFTLCLSRASTHRKHKCFTCVRRGQVLDSNHRCSTHSFRSVSASLFCGPTRSTRHCRKTRKRPYETNPYSKKMYLFQVGGKYNVWLGSKSNDSTNDKVRV